MTGILYYTFVSFLNRTYTLIATEKGLAYVGPDDKNFSSLSYYFKDYKLIEANGMDNNQTHWLKQAKEQLEEYMHGEREVFDLPLDLNHGTSFQQAVWNQLLKVPYGQTTTYGDIAQQINNPKAVRAVGGAVGKNPISIIVPCHRIIGKNGSLTGYSGGLDIKTQLLMIEQIHLP
ncbi:methylated-DNA--[protein]-cysteine S-methyltransferase [Aerococcaceae bacterium WGS1372]